jgi:hypothetical protein
MTKKAVRIYNVDWERESETWVDLPCDHSDYNKIITYIGLITEPDDHILAESDDYDYVAIYEVEASIVDKLAKSYNLGIEILEA